MWSKEPKTGSWIDCLDVIERELTAVRHLKGSTRNGHSLEEAFFHHEMRIRLRQIWRCAGKAVLDLRK